jgi:hypothetical protein
LDNKSPSKERKRSRARKRIAKKRTLPAQLGKRDLYGMEMLLQPLSLFLLMWLLLWVIKCLPISFQVSVLIMSNLLIPKILEKRGLLTPQGYLFRVDLGKYVFLQIETEAVNFQNRFCS